MPVRSRRRVLAIAAGLLVAVAQVAGASPALAGLGTRDAAPRVQTTCAAPGDPVPLTSVQQVSDLAVGTWIRCEGPPQFGDVGGGEVGVQVDANGRFHRLFDGGGGTLIRADGLDQEGEWTVIDTTGINGPGSYQINWSLLGSGTVITSPTFFDAPSSLRLDETAGVARYEPWTGPAPVPGLPPGVGTGECGQPADPVTLSTVAQVQDLLVGAWALCGDRSVLGDTADEVGLEFSADGRFRRLVLDAAGNRIRAVGDGNEGTWDLIDSTAINGPGSFQLDLRIMGRGTVPTFPLFLETPPFVRFVGDGLTGADYLRAEPLPEPPPGPPQTAPPPAVPPPTAPPATATAPSELPATGNGPLTPLLVVALLLTLLGMVVRAWSRVAGSHRGDG